MMVYQLSVFSCQQ